MTNRDRDWNGVASLIDEIVRLPGILLVMGKGPRAVMEGWVDPGSVHTFLQGDSMAVECKSWHCHLCLTDVAEVRFVEAPDPHQDERQAFSVRLMDLRHQPLLMVFFGNMYGPDGTLVMERVDRFHSLKEKYQGLAAATGEA